MLYGIYCQTFPNVNEYDLNCVNPKCKAKFKIKVPNGSLPVLLGDQMETVSTMREILKSTNGNPEKGREIKKSRGLVHKIIRIGLDSSKIIFNLKIPSLEDHLKDSLENLKEGLIEEFTSKNIALLMFIDSILVPNISYYKTSGKLAFFEIRDKYEILKKFSNLSIEDYLKVQYGINDLIEKYSITYKIKTAECPYCGNVTSDIEVDIMSFFIRTIQMESEKIEESNNSTKA